MNDPIWKTLALCSSLSLPAALPLNADEQKDVDREVEQLNNDLPNAGEQQASDRLSDSFTDFAGSGDNANALISGLRSGGEITLTETVIEIQDDPDNPGNTIEVEVQNSLTFVPAADQMSFGGAFILNP